MTRSRPFGVTVLAALVLISGFNLLLAIASILGGSNSAAVEAILPSIVQNGAMLIYCLVPSTKAAFARV